MNFELSLEAQMWKKTVAEFAEKEVAPYVKEYDREERFPIEIAMKMAEQGMLGGVVPEEYGGAGVSYEVLTAGIEEMSRVCHIMGVVMGASSGLIGSGLMNYGTEEQKQKYLRGICTAEFPGGAAVTEPQSGTDVMNMQTTAEIKGDRLVVNGSKTWISGIELAEWFLTFAVTDRSMGPYGVSAFIIEKGTPGFKWHVFKNKVGFRPSSTGELSFSDAEVPIENVVGKVGEGLKVGLRSVEDGRLVVAARGCGMIHACLDASIQYAKERKVFQQEIGRYQLVQSKITDMVVGLQNARFLTYHLAWLRDRGSKRNRQAAAMAKMYATDVAMQAAIDACQIYGAYSCSDDYPVGRYMRDAKFQQIVEGQNDLQRALIAEHVLGFR